MVAREQMAQHRQLVEEPVYLVPRFKGVKALFAGSGAGSDIMRGEDTLVRIEKAPWGNDVGTELRLPGRRLRLDRPDDLTFGERFGNWFAAVFSVGSRRLIWRAGAGVAAEIEETSLSRRALSGRFELDGDQYRVLCDRAGFASRDPYHRRLHDATGLVAELEVNRTASGILSTEFTIWPHRSVRLDALALGVHMMFWLDPGSSGGSGGSGGPGGGGGGGC